MSYLPSRRLFIASAALALLILGALVACSPPSSEPAVVQPTAVPTPAPPTPTPLPRGGNLAIRLAADVPNLRPWQPRSRGEEQLISVMYNGLTRLDDRLQPQPDIAERWDASADGRIITFTLRPDVSWHDGQPLTADDVAFTLDALRTITPTTALIEDLKRIQQVTTPTTATVVLELNERFAPILSDLAVPILPRHLLSGKDIAGLNFWDTPVGTGPFAMSERKPGQSITLAANSNFYRGPPLLDRLAFIVAPDDAVAAQALKEGQLQLAELPWELWRPLPDQLPDAQVGLYPENGYYFMAFNTRPERPFADARVRRALAGVVNVPNLVGEVTQGHGAVIANSAAPNSWADFVRPLTQTLDIEQAGALLDEAGWRAAEPGGIRTRDGAPLAAKLFVRGDDPRRVRAAEIIAEAALTIGMSVTVEPADFATVIQSKYAPPYDFDLLLGSWSNGPGDANFADYIFYDPSDFSLFHSSQINQGVNDQRPLLNIGGFRDPAYDNQAAAAQQLYDVDARSKALKLAQQRIAGQVPYLYLWADQLGVALRPGITTLDGPVNLDTPQYLWNIERWHLMP